MKTSLKWWLPALALVATVAAFLPRGDHAEAIPVPGTKLDVTWDVTYVAPANVFRYRYTVTNNGLGPVTVRLTVAEDQLPGGHGGQHDEVNFVNAGATFNYDQPLAGFPVHNYDWSSLTIPGLDARTVGFDDAVHGPRPEWLAVNGAVISRWAPVPGLRLGEIRLDLGGGRVKAYVAVGSDVDAVGGGFNYKYFLQNSGNVAIGPDTDPPTDNHADLYINEHPTHVWKHHRGEMFNQADNAYAVFGWDSTGHKVEPLPRDINKHNYFWEGLGDGPAALPGGWAPGKILTLGFFDIHGPGKGSWGGRVLGSEETGSFDSPAELLVVPEIPPEGPVITKDTDPARPETQPTANLWLCEDNPLTPALECTNPGEGSLTIAEHLFNGTGVGVGAFEFMIKYDHKLFDLGIEANEEWLGSTGRSTYCAMTIVTENYILYGCDSSGPSPPGQIGSGTLAFINVTPRTDDLKLRMRPTKDNGVITDIIDENCELADIYGEPLPGTLPGGLTEVCGDAHITVRMLEGDLNLDCQVTVADDQAVAYRYGASFGLALYDPWFDLEPKYTDFDIDIKDLQFVFGRNGSTCQEPIPDQPPAEPPQGW